MEKPNSLIDNDSSITIMSLSNSSEFQTNLISIATFKVKDTELTKAKKLYRITLIGSDQKAFVVDAERAVVKSLARNEFFNPGSIIQINKWGKDDKGRILIFDAFGIKSCPIVMGEHKTDDASKAEVDEPKAETNPFGLTSPQQRFMKGLNTTASVSSDEEEDNASITSTASLWESFSDGQRKTLLNLGGTEEDFIDDSVLASKMDSDLTIIKTR